MKITVDNESVQGFLRVLWDYLFRIMFGVCNRTKKHLSEFVQWENQILSRMSSLGNAVLGCHWVEILGQMINESPKQE